MLARLWFALLSPNWCHKCGQLQSLSSLKRTRQRFAQLIFMKCWLSVSVAHCDLLFLLRFMWLKSIINVRALSRKNRKRSMLKRDSVDGAHNRSFYAKFIHLSVHFACILSRVFHETRIEFNVKIALISYAKTSLVCVQSVDRTDSWSVFSMQELKLSANSFPLNMSMTQISSNETQEVLACETRIRVRETFSCSTFAKFDQWPW